MERPLKIVLIGAGGVGKTVWAKKAVYQIADIEWKYVPTLGSDVFSTQVQLEDGGVVSVDVWDTAGQEMYRGLFDGYFHNADAFIVGYDQTHDMAREGAMKPIARLIRLAMQRCGLDALTFLNRLVAFGFKRDIARPDGTGVIQDDRAIFRGGHYHLSIRDSVNELRQPLIDLVETIVAAEQR